MGTIFADVLQGIRRKITTTGYSIYAIAAEGYDFCARGQQNEFGWFSKFRKDAHDGTNYANNSFLSIKAFGWVFTTLFLSFYQFQIKRTFA